jgi:hypothetical protein
LPARIPAATYPHLASPPHLLPHQRPGVDVRRLEATRPKTRRRHRNDGTSCQESHPSPFPVFRRSTCHCRPFSLISHTSRGKSSRDPRSSRTHVRPLSSVAPSRRSTGRLPYRGSTSSSNEPARCRLRHSYVNANTVSVSHLRNDSLSLNCLNNSVSSCIRPTITRHSALSCSMRAFCRSEWAQALL